MTADSWKSLIIKILLMILTPLAAQLHLSMGPTDISAIAADLADLFVLAYGVYRSSGMKLVPHASVAIDPHTPRDALAPVGASVAGKVVGALLIAFALSFLVAGGSAQAQTGNLVKDIAAARAKTVAPKVAVAAPATPTVSALQKFMNDLAAIQAKVVDDTLADLAAADVDAATLTNPADPTSFRDPIAHACYPAAAKFLQSLPAASPATGTLVAVQMFQKQRDFVAQIQAGLPVYLKLGCAPLLGDEVTTLTKIMGLVGVSVGANLLLPGIGAIMPVLP